MPVHKLSHLEHRDDLLAVEYRQQSFVCADVALFLGILELAFADVLPKLFGQFGPGEWVFADHCGQCGVGLHGFAKGVFGGGGLIYNYLYDEKGNRRCLPVLLDKNAQDIPSILEGYTRFELDVFDLENSQSPYSKLYRLLTRQPTRLMTEVGALKKLPPLPQEARRTDFILLIHEAIASIKKTESNTEEILAILKGRLYPPPLLSVLISNQASP